MDQRTRTEMNMHAPVTVILEHDIPTRVDWNGYRYYADETPKPLVRVVADADPSARWVTDWRIAATTPDGESHLFYIKAHDHARWRIAELDPDEAATRPERDNR